MRDKKNSTFVAIVPLLIVLLVGFTPANLAADDDVADIFRPSTFGAVPPTDDAVRIAYPGTVERVAINFPSLTLSPSEKAGLVRVSLERNGIGFLARCTRLTVGPQGTLTWHGRSIEGDGSVIIAFNEDVAFGRIEVNGRVFKIEPDRATPDHLVFEPNPEFAAPICGGELVPESLPPADESPMPGPGAAITTVDLLILYTNGFAAAYPGNQLGAQINFLVAVMNESLWNSRVNMQVRLVGTNQVQFRDTGDLNEPLDALVGQGSAQDEAVFAGVNNLRNQLGADQVSLLRVFDSSNNYCGLAWLWPNVSYNFVGWAYSVVQVGRYTQGQWTYSCSDQTLAHEMGHNWGLHHNLGDQGIFNYSLGFRFGNGQYMTVMSYRSQGGSEQTVSHFSNPKVRYQGYKTGSKKCNSAKSINTVRQTVAGWRPTWVSQDNKAPKNKTRANFINNGSASTTSRNVTLNLFGKDKRGVVGYYASESSATPAAWQAGWVAVATTKKYKNRNVQFTLSSGTGVRTVYVWFRDASGNVSKVKSDTITLQ